MTGRRILLLGTVGYLALLLTAVDAATWRRVSLVQEDEDGRLDVDLLRPLAWLGDAGEGDWVELDLEEMGAAGAFQILAVGPCPEIEEGPGCLVLGAFRHSRGVVAKFKARYSGADVKIVTSDGNRS